MQVTTQPLGGITTQPLGKMGEFPRTMKAAFGKGKDKKLEIREVPIPTPDKDEVLIKVFYSTINPSDLMMLSGKYPTYKDLNDFVPGWEGCGIVIASGGGRGDKIKNGTKVGFYVTRDKKWGAWAEYTIARADFCLKLPDDFDLRYAAGPLINPCTVLSMVEEIKAKKYKAIVQDGAFSMVGKFLLTQLKDEGVKTINIVRQDDHLDQLRAMGGDIVLNSEDKNFHQALKSACNALQPTAYFDCVAGDLPVEVLKDMPEGSTLYTYGALGDEGVGKVPVNELIFKGKHVEGFFLGRRIECAGGSMWDFKFFDKIPKLLTTTFRTDWGDAITLENINTAIESYKDKKSDNKILISCCKC